MYQRNEAGNVIGFFGFEYDQEERTRDGERHIQFYTGYSADAADDSPPMDVYDEINRLLRPHFENFEVGAAESLHIIENIYPSRHQEAIHKIREIMTSAGWTEMSE